MWNRGSMADSEERVSRVEMCGKQEPRTSWQASWASGHLCSRRQQSKDGGKSSRSWLRWDGLQPCLLTASQCRLQSSCSIALVVLISLAAHFLSTLTLPLPHLSFPGGLPVDLRLPAHRKGVAPKLRGTKCLSIDRPASEGARAMENPS